MSPTPSEMSMVSMVDFETSILDESIRRVSRISSWIRILHGSSVTLFVDVT